MSDTITVNVEDLRTHVTFTDNDRREAGRRLRAALAEHDKAEQQRLDALVFVSIEDVPVHTDFVRFVGHDFYEVDAYYVEALGEFYPHQTDHAFRRDGDLPTCYECGCPEWAHTPPAVPDWQADEAVEFIEAGRDRDVWRRHEDGWLSVDTGVLWSWEQLERHLQPVTPVGWRRDLDSITIPKSALDGLHNKDDSAVWEKIARGADHYGFATMARLARAVADALEVGQ